ncbi:MAG: choice-of-anchor Q domain-containing protein, partial [Lysobacteraceae bacterium]
MQQDRQHALGLNLQRLLWALMWLGLLLGWSVTPASAVTYTVSNTNDSGAGSLRQAMTQALSTPADDEIVFAPSANGVITLASPLPDLLAAGGALTITGNGPANTIIDGAGAHRPFYALFQDNLRFTVRQLTLRNGSTDGEGGAIYLGANNGSLTIEDAEFVNNRAYWEGGAIRSAGAAVTVRNSLFQGNTVVDAYGSGISVHDALLKVSNSSFTGHGLDSVFFVQNSTTWLVNVTATGNDSIVAAVLTSGGTLYLSNCLLVGNAAADLRAINGTTVVYNDSHNNIIGLQNGTTFIDGVNNNQIGVTAPLLGTLGNYGGTTRTIPLLPGSPAINAGIAIGDNGSNLPTTPADQRGFPRVGAIDVGAFESQGFALAAVGGDGQSAIVGTAFSAPLIVSVSPNGSGEPVEGGIVRFSAPTSGASAVPATPAASITSGGQAQTLVTANATAGGPYSVTASAAGTTPASVDFSLTNTPAGNPACAGFSFP